MKSPVKFSNAAIMGYLHHKDNNISTDAVKNQLILVFDWGGGTLDIALVPIKDGILMNLSKQDSFGIFQVR